MTKRGGFVKPPGSHLYGSRPVVPIDRTVKKLLRQLAIANKELILILWIVFILWLMNVLEIEYRAFLNFYNLPVLVAAYYFGKRLATLTALLCVLSVVLSMIFNARLLESAPTIGSSQRWFDVVTWAGFLVVTGYTMGVLQDAKVRKVLELKEAYNGVVELASYIVSQDEYTHSHSRRMAFYATRIAQTMGIGDERLEDLRAAAMLHDIGKLEISRDILYKATRLTDAEYQEMKTHVDKGVEVLRPVGGALGRVIPIILAHHEHMDGSGYQGKKGGEIPIEARIVAVADAYDVLISDRPYKKALPTWEAKDAIVRGAGTRFDPDVVKAFVRAYDAHQLEMVE